MTQNADVPSEDELSEILDDVAQSQMALCDRLDEIVGDNTLVAARDGTLSSKLTMSDLNADDWNLIKDSEFLPPSVLRSNSKKVILAGLHKMLYGLSLCFRFLEIPLEVSWAYDMHFFPLSEELQLLPPTEYATLMAQLARRTDMNDAEIFAFVEYMCFGDPVTLH